MRGEYNFNQYRHLTECSAKSFGRMTLAYSVQEGTISDIYTRHLMFAYAYYSGGGVKMRIPDESHGTVIVGNLF